MSVIGIANRNAAINNLYQNTKKSDNNTAGNFGETMNAAQSTDGNAVASNADSFKKSTRGIDAITAYNMETRLTSGIIGFGGLEDGTVYSASYDESSTMGNSIINIRMESRSGEVKTYKVSINQVDCSNATQLEIFALCSHADKMGMTDSLGESNSYSNLLHYAQNSTFGNQTAKTADDFMSAQKNWNAMVSDSQIDKMEKEGKIDSSVGKNLQSIFETMEKFNADSGKVGVSRTKLEEQALLEQKKKYDRVPYGHMAKDGVIEYNGVVFVCDTEHNAIHLGDTSNPKDCIRVSLSKGGSLIFNRDNIGDLAKAIGMFSPEDVNLIMRAIAQDAKIQQMEKEIDDITSGIGEAGETETADTEDGEKE
ncbi:MAG: hypothetical protein NC433_07165 [Clostridiales bacterium]|nr:hypothetical protein [Clostridiales bacterium]